MEYRNWSQNGARTSLLGFGCMRFPTNADGTIDEPRAEALLNTAKAAGVNYFDTVCRAGDLQMGPQQLLPCHQDAAVDLQKSGRCQARF